MRGCKREQQRQVHGPPRLASPPLRSSIPNLPALWSRPKNLQPGTGARGCECLDMGGTCYVKTLLEHVTGVEDCHFRRVA